MQFQVMHPAVQLNLELGVRAIKDTLADVCVDEQSKVKASLPLQLEMLPLCTVFVHKWESREVVHVLRFGRIISAGLAHDSA